MTYPQLAPEAPTPAPTALLVAAFDSQLKWCARIRDELVARGFRCRAVVPDQRSALSETQIADAGFVEVAPLSWADLMDAVVEADVVVCALSGPLTKTLLIDLAERLGGTTVPGPVVVTGWVGVIIEKITAGYLDRSGSDVIAVNSTRDLEHFRHTARLLVAAGRQPAARRAAVHQRHPDAAPALLSTRTVRRPAHRAQLAGRAAVRLPAADRLRAGPPGPRRGAQAPAPDR